MVSGLSQDGRPRSHCHVLSKVSSMIFIFFCITGSEKRRWTRFLAFRPIFSISAVFSQRVAMISAILLRFLNGTVNPVTQLSISSGKAPLS